ncbi:hypothetical protein [Bradyrhizobium sp. LTSP885]|uniref:hypothetical protein n=1 Tax=Bradyrhizobium sp. LTSP885 TaxID=1619232 RepID=UPI000ABE0C4C
MRRKSSGQSGAIPSPRDIGSNIEPQSRRAGMKPIWLSAIVPTVAPRTAAIVAGSLTVRRPYGFFHERQQPPGEGTAMRIGWASFRGLGTGHLGTAGIGVSLVVPLIAVAGIAAWLMLPDPSDADDLDDAPASSAIILAAQNASIQNPLAEAQPGQAATATVPAVEPAAAGIVTAPEAKPEKSPLDGLRIASQSWRRGGLGSKALVTLTLRNANDFAVKDIEIACAFIRRDGSPLTERKRLISDTIAMRSRKTYPRMLIGFVNINAIKAKCSVVTASRL